MFARMLAALLLAGCALAAERLYAREWYFDVAADGMSIGKHRIVVQDNGDSRTVTSEMNFGMLGISVYRQHAKESWTGDCLTHIESRTEESGRVTTISGRQEGNAFRIDGPYPQQLYGCVMSFAYWNQHLLKQSHLVNVQTGAWTSVNISDLGRDTIEVRGESVPAFHFAVDTESNAIEVWYSPQGEWVGLKSTTKKGGHVLTYRLGSRAG